MVVGGGAFGKWLGHEGGAFLNGIVCLIKETPESSLAPSTLWEHSEKVAVYKTESGPSADNEIPGTLILDFLVSRAVRIKLLCL